LIGDDLLQVAQALAQRQPREGKQAFLRRSISTSYYAVFHSLAQLCADQLIGASKRRQEAWRRTYRALEHGFAKNTLVEMRKQVADSDLELFAQIFLALQQERHDADYDPHRTYGRADALAYARSAEDAIQALRALSPTLKLELATSVLLRTRR
jgi:uncharacterized protein (UPF0332 family)